MPSVGLAVGIAALALALRLRDPHTQGSWGACPTAYLTGYACPLCGGLRAVSDLTRGDALGAFSSNALFVAAIPAVALWWLTVVRDRWTNSPRTWDWPLRHPAIWPTVTALALAFTLMRNAPVAAWLMP